MKTISFIIPTIRKSKFLDDLLFFLVDINLGKVILIDNSGSGELQKQQLTKYGNITYIYSKEQGLGLARNKGAEIANSDYLYFFDDDIIPQNKILRATNINSILKNKDTFDCIGGNILLPSTCIPHKQLPIKYYYIYGEKNFGDKDHYINNDYFGPTNLIIHREVFNSCGGFDTSYGHIGILRGCNEDIFLQERIRRKKYHLFFKSGIDVIHKGYIPLNEKEIKERINLQGKFDYYLDKKLNQIRIYKRFIKYISILSLEMIIYPISKRYSYDYFRYKSYLYELFFGNKK